MLDQMLNGASAAATTIVDAGTSAVQTGAAYAAPMASALQTGTLEITLDTQKLFDGANLMTSALSSPFLFIAGLGLGVAILGAIIRAVQSVRL